MRDRARRDSDEVAAPAASAPATNAEKIRLFRSLFRGREDVFARRWENPKTGKAGYAPACANEWVPSVCIKRSDMGLAGRRGTCSECTAQAYVPLTDDEIAAHLRGQQVLGVYPLLADETCWFLAADFDDDGWTGDIAAFRETCDSFGVPVAVERSRSGNGAHAWVFFSAPVAAVVARQLGCFLLTETMSRRHQLTMASYDRLFPNQDTMPKGGFGNLIALPLQKVARDNGNSTFVDGDLVPFADPWAFLAGMTRMRPGEVKALTESALRSGRVLGVRQPLTGDDESAPWERLPSGRPPRSPITEPLPASANAVIAQRLYLEKADCPLLCSAGSSASPPSRIPSSTRSRVCACRPR